MGERERVCERDTKGICGFAGEGETRASCDVRGRAEEAIGLLTSTTFGTKGGAVSAFGEATGEPSPSSSLFSLLERRRLLLSE